MRRRIARWPLAYFALAFARHVIYARNVIGQLENENLNTN